MIRNRKGHLALAIKIAALKQTDHAVLSYLDELRRGGARDTCKASIPQIHAAANVSPRQVQISIQRLIANGLIMRVAYDFGNSDRKGRGTIFKLLISAADMDRLIPRADTGRAIRSLAYRQAELEACIERLAVAQDRMQSQIARMSMRLACLRDIKRVVHSLPPDQQRELAVWLGDLLRTGPHRKRVSMRILGEAPVKVPSAATVER